MTKRIVALGAIVLALGACSRSDCKEDLSLDKLDGRRFEIRTEYEGGNESEEWTAIQFDETFDLKEILWNKKTPDNSYLTTSEIQRIQSDKESDYRLQVNAHKSGYGNLYNAQYKLEGEAMLCTRAATYTESGENRA